MEKHPEKNQMHWTQTEYRMINSELFSYTCLEPLGIIFNKPEACCLSSHQQ